MRIRLNFNKVYKGIYITRVILFLIMLYVGLGITFYLTNQNIMYGLTLTTYFIVITITCIMVIKNW